MPAGEPAPFLFLFVAAYPFWQQRLGTEMVRLKEIKEKQLKSLRVCCCLLPPPSRCSLWSSRRSRRCQSSLLGRKIQVQQLLTQHMNLMHEVYSTLLQRDLSAALPCPPLPLPLPLPSPRNTAGSSSR